MRNSTEIRVWMLRNGHTVESIRLALGHANHTPVSLTISGKEDTRSVLRYLVDQGCPAKYLNLPKDMETVS